ncbi:MAG: SxtJ family membrane protein [Pseudomonadota bacterium]
MDHPPLTADSRTLREFGLVFAGGLIVCFGLLIPWLLDRPWVWQTGGARWPWVAAAVFAGVGIVQPRLLKPVYLFWMKLGHVLGWINTRIILGIIFFLVFMPVALLFRLTGRDPMERRLDPAAASYRQPSEQLPPDRMEKPF